MMRALSIISMMGLISEVAFAEQRSYPLQVIRKSEVANIVER